MNYQPEKVSKYVQDTKKTVGLKEDKKMPNPYYVVVENFDPLNFYFFFLFFPFLPIVVFKGQFTAQFPAILVQFFHPSCASYGFFSAFNKGLYKEQRSEKLIRVLRWWSQSNQSYNVTQ